MTKDQLVFLDILVNEDTQQFGLKESLPGCQLTTRCKSTPYSRQPTDRTRIYVPRKVVQEKFNTSERLKKCLQYSIQQALKRKGQIAGGRMWLGWLLYPICKLHLRGSAGLQLRTEIKNCADSYYKNKCCSDQWQMAMALKSLVNTARHATAASCTCTVDRETVPSRHGARDMNNVTNSQSWQMNCNDTKLLAWMTGTMALKSLVNTACHATAESCTVDREPVPSHGARDMNNVNKFKKLTDGLQRHQAAG